MIASSGLLKRMLLAGASALAILTSASAAGAVTYAGPGEYAFTAPSSGVYDITAAGAQGGSSFNGLSGGLGAIVGGDIALTAGETLEILVGGQGQSGNFGSGYAGGGGGFSGVALPVGVLNILFAGAGGGAGVLTIGGPGLVISSGGAGAGPNGGTGGGGGFGGYGGSFSGGGNGGGGTGYFGAGMNGQAGGTPYGQGGNHLFGGSYQAAGGLGGGGGSGFNGGGGGGGASGGGGGDGDPEYAGGGGGGGSFIPVTFFNTFAFSGANYGNGYVSISQVASVPEPSTWTLMLSGFSAVGLLAMRRRRPRKA